MENKNKEKDEFLAFKQDIETIIHNLHPDDVIHIINICIKGIEKKIKQIKIKESGLELIK